MSSIVIPKYTLFKSAISEGPCETTQQLVRYIHFKLSLDFRPTNIIEREYPIEINNTLPSVLIWDSKEYILGGDNVLHWYYELVKENIDLDYDEFIAVGREWSVQNPDYRINDHLQHKPTKKEDFNMANTFLDQGETNEVITFMSLNLWNDRFRMEHRFVKFCEVVTNIEPDIICLQEVNQLILQKLLQQEWTKSYFKSTNKIHPNRPCGELILSKFPILKKESFPFNNTLTQQHVHVAHIQIPLNYFQSKLSIENDMECMSFPVITTQLEKLKGFGDIRKQQLMDLFGMVSKLSTSFLLVDTNITDDQSDSVTIPEGWNDAYEEHKEYKEFLSRMNIDSSEEENYSPDSDEVILNNDDNKFTYDSEKNIYLSGYQRFRYDRLFYRSSTAKENENSSYCGGWKCVDYQLVCNDIPVSTHFGIFATFHRI